MQLQRTNHSEFTGFHTTQWSMVLAAGRSGDTQAREALDELCRIYWRPLYAFFRSRGNNPADAQDLTQGFFEHFLENHFLAAAQPAKGRFRSYLLTAARHFLTNQWHHQNADKRGGKCTFVPIEVILEEGRYGLEPVDNLSPEKAFDRQWALTILERAMEQLELEYRKAGKSQLFETLKDRLMGDQNAPAYAEVAAKLGLNETNARAIASRLRRRFRELVRAEIAQTVPEPADIEEEIGQLFAAFER